MHKRYQGRLGECAADGDSSSPDRNDMWTKNRFELRDISDDVSRGGQIYDVGEKGKRRAGTGRDIKAEQARLDGVFGIMVVGVTALLLLFAWNGVYGSRPVHFTTSSRNLTGNVAACPGECINFEGVLYADSSQDIHFHHCRIPHMVLLHTFLSLGKHAMLLDLTSRT